MFYLLHVYKYQIDEIPGELYMCCERRNLLCNHSNGDLFTCEDNMLFSHVSKISCFHMKAHLVFHWCLYNKKICIIPLLQPRTIYREMTSYM